MLLSEAVPAEQRVLLAPFDVRYGVRTALQPDLVVARRVDLGRKRDLLAELGCPTYWTVEPHGPGDLPELTVWELRAGSAGYVEAARVGGDDAWVGERPCRVRVVPAELLD